ncbi:MAG: uroporphyrinogen decarboxylase [Alphaproteobacteria bacterium]|nr:uroporphyrinogen decarboxylase [Alphaproteobacteria bacterium]
MLLINKLNKTKQTNIPIWIMRQAGRYLPEYRQLRTQFPSFLDFCYTKNAVTEATLQPIERFGLDAAIIFSDILIIPDALGLDVDFKENEGPIVEKINHEKIFQKLNLENIISHLQPVYQAIKQTRTALNADKALIGFCGAPWTLACYMISGQNIQNFHDAKKMLYCEPVFFQKIINLLTEAIILCLKEQIKAGINVIQIFDSWAGLLPPDEFMRFSILPTVKIITAIRQDYPDIPIIGFPRGGGEKIIDYAKQTKINALQCDEFTQMSDIARKIPNIVFQGNLDPLLLLGDEQQLIHKTHTLLNQMNSYHFVFNLGHGISKHTDPDKVRLLIDVIRNFTNDHKNQ